MNITHVQIDEEMFLPAFRHILDSDVDIEMLWGGRDSGKSRHIAQRLIMDCMSESYFRCILIKKTAQSIKDAQWQTIKDVVEEWGISSLFTFKQSPLEINCINGNKFIARGCDNAENLKSISNPSHTWVEEANQLELADYIVLGTTLRSNDGAVKQWFSFNPESEGLDYSKHWLYTTFFKDKKSLSFTSSITTELEDGEQVELTYRSTHTTYKDNPFVSRERKAFHQSLKKISPYYYTIYTLGLWGNVTSDDLWVYTWDRSSLGKPELNPDHEVYLSWDFNRNPACCSVIQWYDDTIYVLETIKRAGVGTEGMCDIILMNYPDCMFIVTGDYSGNTPSSIFEEEVTNYTMIKSKLGLMQNQIKIMPNPKLKKNAVLVNTIIKHYPLVVHDSKCDALVYDFENVRKIADGTIKKTNREDPAQQADALDTFRYFCNRFLADFRPLL